MKNKNIFIGLIEIAGYYNNLAEGLREMGYTVHFAGRTSNIYQYDDKKKSDFCYVVKAYNYLIKKRIGTSRKKLIVKSFWALLVEVWKIPLFFWAVSKCDVFIFSYGTSFMYNNLDIRFLGYIGKRVISNVAHGTDARPPYIDGTNLSNEGVHWTPNLFLKAVKKKKKKLFNIEKYSSVVISSPMSGQFLQKKFINSFIIGVPLFPIPLQASKIDPIIEREIRILHAPSNIQVKGTLRIRKCIDNLKQKGYRIKYIEIVGRPNKDVINEIANSDLVIDQLYSDTPLAGLATEAAWQMKPTLVGGYAWNELYNAIPEEKFPPSLIFHPDHFESYLEEVLNAPEKLKGFGIQAYNFVLNNWAISYVSSCYKLMIDDDVPDFWYYNPVNIRYTLGLGMTKEHISKVMVELIGRYGISSLGLGHNPLLEAEFMKLVNSKND